MDGNSSEFSACRITTRSTDNRDVTVFRSWTARGWEELATDHRASEMFFEYPSDDFNAPVFFGL